MIKALLIDLDGVIIQPRHKYFSQKLSEEYDIPLELIMPFFRNDYKNAATGKVSIKDILPYFLKKWNWNKSLDAFLNYWFESENDINLEVVEQIEQIRKKGIKVYIASDNERERGNYIMNIIELKNHVDGTFFSYEVKHTKSEKVYFEKVIEQLGIEAEEVFYTDDDPENIRVAKSLGIQTMLYQKGLDLVNMLTISNE